MNGVDSFPRWYAIHTRPKQEERAEHNLKAWKIETFHPKIKECRYNQFSGRPIQLSKSLFRRYLFAKFDASRSLHSISFTRGVQAVVSSAEGPIPVDDEIVNLIQSRVGEDGFVGLKEDFKSGDWITIKEGPLRALTGIFQHKVKDSDRVVILLALLNYQARVVIERGLVAKAG